MANIPGISGYIQPGVFARDRVVSRGVSLPGGLRTVCVLGEGLREETVVAAAKGLLVVGGARNTYWICLEVIVAAIGNHVGLAFLLVMIGLG